MKHILMRWMREPLLHFLVAALILYAVTQTVQSPQSDRPATDDTIVVDDAALLRFLQYRAQAFNTAEFEQRLADLAPAERDELERQFLREEALYREALALGLDRSDYIIRQRLVEKLLFVIDSTEPGPEQPAEAELAAWFEPRASDYRTDTVYDFAHVFFAAEGDDMQAAQQRAETALQEGLPDDAATAASLGDTFPFLQDYAGRTRDFVNNNFGADFVQHLDMLSVDGQTWAGPLGSRYGQHLVLLRDRQPGHTSRLEDIRERVLQDYLTERVRLQREAAIDRIVARYPVQRGEP